MDSVPQNAGAAHSSAPSGFISTTYIRYKSHTAAFLTWLGAQRGSIQFASIRDYVVAAEELKEAHPSFRMPQDMLEHLEDAISLRRACSAYYEARSLPEFTSTHGDPSEDIESQGHRHFISELEKMKLILWPSSTEDQTNPSKAQATRSRYISPGQQQKKEQDLSTSNRFEVLPLENCEEDESTVPQKLVMPAIQPLTQSSRNESEDDALLAIYCLIEDLNHVKTSIISMWDDYRDHKLSLMNAAVTSNTLLRYAEHLETSFYHDYRHIISEEQLLEYVLLRSPEQDKAKINASGLSDDDFPRVISDHLNGWRLSDDDGVLVPDVPGNYNSDITGLNPMQVRRARQITFLREVLLEYRFMFAVHWFPFAVDQVAQAFLRLVRGDKVSLWMIVSVQMMIEIKELLGPDVSRGLSEMQSSTRNIVATLDEYKRFEGRLELASNLKQQRKSAEITLLQIKGVMHLVREYVLDDGLSRIKEICFPPSLSALIGPRQKCFLLANHPISCGLYDFRLKNHFQNITMNTFKWQELLIATIHLYNAFSIKGGLLPSWERMEDLLRIWEKNSFFTGEPPSEFDQAYRYLLYEKGVPIDALAPTSRSKPGRVWRAPRKFNKFHYTPSFDHLIAFFYGAESVDERYPVEHFRLLLVKEEKAESQDGISGPWAFKEQLHRLLAANEEKLNFNLLYMYRLCARLLRNLAARSGDEFKWRLEYKGGIQLWTHAVNFPLWVLADINSVDPDTTLSGSSKLEDARIYTCVFVGVVEHLEAIGYLPNFTHSPVTEETRHLQADEEEGLNTVTKEDGPILRGDTNTDGDINQEENEHPTSSGSARVSESAVKHPGGSEAGGSVPDVRIESQNPLVKPHKVIADEPGWKRYYFPRINGKPTAAKRAEIKAEVQAVYLYDPSDYDNEWVESTIDRIWAYRGAEEA